MNKARPNKSFSVMNIQNKGWISKGKHNLGNRFNKVLKFETKIRVKNENSVTQWYDFSMLEKTEVILLPDSGWYWYSEKLAFNHVAN